MKKIFLAMALAIGLMATAQVKIGANPTNINAASILEIESTTQGVLFPRVALANTTTATLAGGAHVQGMTVYNTATAGDVTPGMYTSDGTKWVKLSNNAETPLNVTTEQTGNYTALATDDIILMNPSGTKILTLPTSGINIGKKFYVSVIGSNSINLSPTARETTTGSLYSSIGYTLMYIGGSSDGSYSIISGQ